jgi:TPR repeat protein
MTDINNQALLKQAKIAIEAGHCEEAIPLLLPLAESGDMEAQYLLGYMYFADCDYPFADSVARDWLVKAREQGHAEACYHLAWFPNAEGVSSIDDAEVLNLLIEAGERGSVEAQRYLGACFAVGDWAGGKDEAKAVEWYTKAAEQGHALSQYDLGFMWLLGEGTAQDTLKGMEWLNKAGEQGELLDCRLLTDIYRQGMFGVAIDPEKARYWEGRCSSRGKI